MVCTGVIIKWCFYHFYFAYFVGANEDSQRISDLILNHLTEIDEIYVTLDSHHVSF